MFLYDALIMDRHSEMKYAEGRRLPYSIYPVERALPALPDRGPANARRSRRALGLAALHAAVN